MTQASTRWPRLRHRVAIGYSLLAALAYVPILRTSPGKVVADTKSYLYLDPGRVLERASSMWDPNIGLGTVTHQNIGYLFPMGPFYWLFHAVGVPAWVAQRIWLGTIFLFAALGVLYLLRTLNVRGPGVVAAALVFMLTPYSMNFASRLSVLLLPWAGLPWILALVVRALREKRGWMYPAIFAIVIQIIGSVNATALIFAGIAPVLWVLYALFVLRETTWQRTLEVVAKIAALTILASLWWIAGLSLQSGYGLDMLKYTETLQTVSTASTPLEVVRGLGYWFFYGVDRIGQWITGSVAYTQHLWLIAVGFAIPILALVASAVLRWRYRAFFVILTVVGVIVAVGAEPYDSPTPLGSLFKSFANSSNFGLALRSTGRAAPLIILGLSVLLGVGINAAAGAWERRGTSWQGVALAGAVAVLAFVNLPTLWNGSIYGANLERNEAIPQYWTDAIAAMNAEPHDTRVLEIPGADFAAYRWGQTVDPITPGLMDRPYVARELVPWGSPAGANLLIALDRRLQEGVLDPNAIAPIARLMNVGDVVFRADLETDRFGIARAKPTWQLLTSPRPQGLAAPRGWGTSLGRPLKNPQQDEIALALPPTAKDPPPVSDFPVDAPVAIVGTGNATSPLIVSGDGEGLVDLAAIGNIGNRVILYSGSYAKDPAALRREVEEPGSVLVVTDSNRKRGQRWGSTLQVEGATERPDQKALTTDERDNRLPVFPGATTNAQTVLQTPGLKVDQSSYGNPDLYWPEDLGTRALDGDPTTAWRVGENTKVIGERLRITVAKPVTTDHIVVTQPDAGPAGRYITKATLTFDGKDSRTVAVTPKPGPTESVLRFPRRTFHTLEITIADTNFGDDAAYPHGNAVGFSEVQLRDDRPGSPVARVDPVVRMPVDLVDAARSAAATRPLVYSISRSRTVVIPPRTGQDEPSIARELTVPNARTFAVRGTARLSPNAPGEATDAALGLPDPLTVTTSGQLPGTVNMRGSAAFDGDPATAWTTPFAVGDGQWIQAQLAQPVSFDHLNLEVVADGRHSVPTKVVVSAGGQSRQVALPSVKDQSAKNATVSVPIRFAPLTGDQVRVTIAGVRPVMTKDYFTQQPIQMPVGLAEVGIPGVQRAAVPAQMPATCRSDLVTIDGSPFPLRVAGSTSDALALRPLDLVPCGPTSVHLTAGTHMIRSAPGARTGIDVDGLVLASNAQGDAMQLGRLGAFPATLVNAPSQAAGSPKVTVTHNGRTKLHLDVTGATPGQPFWLVLGQSQSSGWRATVAGKQIGTSTLVNGFANGWRVTPTSKNFSVTLEWVPQRRVWISLAISGVTIAACLALAIFGLVRRRRRRAAAPPVALATADEHLANPLVAAGHTPGPALTVAAAAFAGLLGWLTATPLVGVLAAAAVLVVALRPRGRGVLTIGPPILIALGAAYVILRQYRHRFVSDLNWPGRFTRVSDLVWLAVMLLAADLLVELIRSRRRTDDP
ncbi:MAG TPA: alpha-(1-_3)-arabinofuranosyltransferase family protein [Acidimicrobiia bacterium]